jgi:ribonuclease D
MLEYAAQDVIYLPKVYEQMKDYFKIPYMDKYYNSRGEQVFESMTVLEKVFNDSQRCF